MRLIVDSSSRKVITDYELAALLGRESSPHRRYGLVKRAIASKELIPLRRGLYAVAHPFDKEPPNLFELAQRIYGPSYVSLESALSYHGWIPEAVYAITSVCVKRSVEFRTPLGVFSYTRIPTSPLFAGVKREASAGGTYFMASAVKALAEIVYVHKKNWSSLADAVADLRLDEQALRGVTRKEIDDLLPAYGSRRIRSFLTRVRKDLR